MAKINFPETIRVAMLRIASLTDEQFQELCSGLENLPLRINQRSIFDYSGLETKSISLDDLDSIQAALFPIYVFQGTANTPLLKNVDDLVDDIVESLQEAKEERGNLNKFKERLTRLLSLDRPKLIAKANDVLTGQKPTYSTGRIFTDIRPVFADEIESLPEAALIVHVLRVSYYTGGKEQEFIVALDNKDIQQLIDTLERAKKKAEILGSVISSANMSLIDIV